jgi:hypothetical protein
MSKITNTKRNRARVATIPVNMDGKIGYMRSNTIVGYEPPTDRQASFNPKNPNQFVLLSPGQRFNWGKVNKKMNGYKNTYKGIIYKVK